jgi:ribonuclease P protein component
MVAKTTHFALHRNVLTASSPAPKSAGSAAVTIDASSGAPKAGPALLFPSSDLWLGAMVPKRWAKRAVTRNAIKRQIYTVSADFSPADVPAAFVVRLRRDFARKEFVSASSELLKAAVRSELLQLFEWQPARGSSSRGSTSSAKAGTPCV